MKECCGTSWPDTANFCPTCGNGLQAPEAEASAEPEEAAADETSTEPVEAGEDDTEATVIMQAVDLESLRSDMADDPEETSEEAQPGSEEVVMGGAADDSSPNIPAPDVAADTPEPRDGGDRQFSETSWFLAAEDIEEHLKELEYVPEEVSKDAEDYRPQDNMKSDVRRRYSLRTQVRPRKDSEKGD